MVPFWSKFVPLGADSFTEEGTLAVQESKQEVTKVVSFVKMAENLPRVSITFIIHLR